MTQAKRLLDKFLLGLAPLQGSSPPLVKIMLEAAKYSRSVTPPKWLSTKS